MKSICLHKYFIKIYIPENRNKDVAFFTFFLYDIMYIKEAIVMSDPKLFKRGHAACLSLADSSPKGNEQ